MLTFLLTHQSLTLSAIPARVVQIFADPFIIKVGIELKSMCVPVFCYPSLTPLAGDCILLLRHYAVPVYNGWELSQLWKCMHPSIDVAPLTSHISLDDMARILLGVRLNKEMQTSDWSSLILSVAQIECEWASDRCRCRFVIFAQTPSSTPTSFCL